MVKGRALLMAGFISSLLGLAGCSSPITALDVVVSASGAAVAAVPILESLSVITDATGTTIVDYASAINTAAQSALTEEDSNDTPAQKAAKIVAAFSGIAVPAFGPTVGPEVRTLIQAITSTVSAFLAQVNDPKVMAMVAGKGVAKADEARVRGMIAQTDRAARAWRELHPHPHPHP